MSKKNYFRPVKAYKNNDFLNSADARVVRILSEYLEPVKRFREQELKDTIVFFGSSRARPLSETKLALERVNARIKEATKVTSELRRRHEEAERKVRLSRYYEDAVKLSKKLTRWSKKLKGRGQHRFIICSGGGPGIMEATNKGSAQAKGKSMGLGISLPMEPVMNDFVSRELAFEFHYFFMRKFWFVYPAKAMVIFPGGFGTMDELFELLTLVQTRKLTRKIPIVIYGREFWEKVINFNEIEEWGTIDPGDQSLFFLTDSIEEAFQYLTSELKRLHL